MSETEATTDSDRVEPTPITTDGISFERIGVAQRYSASDPEKSDLAGLTSQIQALGALNDAERKFYTENIRDWQSRWIEVQSEMQERAWNFSRLSNTLAGTEGSDSFIDYGERDMETLTERAEELMND